MLEFFGKLLFALGLALSLWSSPAQAETTIVIVRHGEKPPLGLGQLSCQGLNRSLALPASLLRQFGPPVAIFAPNPAQEKIDKGQAYAYVRPLATIEPLAVQMGLPVNLQFGMDDIQALSEVLAKQPNGTVVVAWEHHWGERLARALLQHYNADPGVVPTWLDSDFDSIYVLRIQNAGLGAAKLRFSREQEGLNGQSVQCPSGVSMAR